MINICKLISVIFIHYAVCLCVCVCVKNSDAVWRSQVETD